jgi:pimeloyl-ACP methyl ester carboxylesterase
MGARPQAILLPGAVLPADLAYGALLEALGDEAEAVAKELEVYAGEVPPPNYALDVEVQGILRAAEASGFARFHLVGYSAGGASSLAFAAKHPERLGSLALLEPAWAGNEGLDPAEEAALREIDRVTALPPKDVMPAFVRSQLAPGVRRDRRRPGWRSGQPDFTRSCGRSAPATSTWTRLVASILPSTSRWAASATPTTTPRWPSAWPACLLTSRSRCSRSAITSTRRTGRSPSG